MLQVPLGPPPTNPELSAAVLQAAVAFGLSAYAGFLHRRYRKPYFFWFALGWLIYGLRIGCISAFLVTQQGTWLYLHQVLTGWTALALLWAALSFSRQLAFRPVYAVALAFPILWSYAALYVMRSFLLAALLSVVLLSVVTAYTGWLFISYWRQVRLPGSLLLGLAQLLWAVHHLDYPFLRAQGAWAPWGYYLDIAFLLATATGLTVLVLDDLRQGFGALASLAGGTVGESVDAAVGTLLARAMELPAARGSAYFSADAGRLRFVRGAGACAAWADASLSPAMVDAIRRAVERRHPEVLHDALGSGDRRVLRRHAYLAVLPVVAPGAPAGALVMVGNSRDPFAALDEDFLVTLGAQLAGALRTAALTQRLRERSDELGRLASRTVRQHEEERRRLSRELHDETAQVFSAVKLQLGVLRETAHGHNETTLDRALDLVDDGMRSIRSVTESLRPIVLDELGLVPALRSLADDVAARCGLEITVDAPPALPRLGSDAELALYRALQESLSNVVRHAQAHQVRVLITTTGRELSMVVEDDGRGLPSDVGAGEHMGLTGMRERVTSLGGTLSVDGAGDTGVRVNVTLPVTGTAGDFDA